MTGWKTWAGLGIYVASAALGYLESSGICAGCSNIAQLLQQIGEGFIGVGVAHKLEKGAGAIAAALKR